MHREREREKKTTPRSVLAFNDDWLASGQQSLAITTKNQQRQQEKNEMKINITLETLYNVLHLIYFFASSSSACLVAKALAQLELTVENCAYQHVALAKSIVFLAVELSI